MNNIIEQYNFDRPDMSGVFFIAYTRAMISVVFTVMGETSVL